MKRAALILLALSAFGAATATGDDWPMGGRTRDRNPVSHEKNAPRDWQIESPKQPPRNIRWTTQLSGYALGGPVVAQGLVWVGSSNFRNPLDPAITGDRGVLACFREADGKFLYQYTAPRLEKYTQDWPHNGISGSPIVEGDKLWFITNRREVVCLDIAPLRTGVGVPKELWKYDLVAEQKIVPSSPMIHTHNTLGSLAIYKNLLFVPTGNGVSADHPGATKINSPESPSLICLQKDMGTLIWKDSSAGKVGYGGHSASPLVVEIAGEAQVIHPQADGWVRSYAVDTGKPLWQFDANFKDGKWDWTGDERSKSVVTATPVYADGRVYFAKGREHEFSTEYGRLFCVDPTKTGDVSPELDDGKGGGKPNPNSAVVWEFRQEGPADRLHLGETSAAVAVADGLAIVVDASALVHCFDAATGRRYWAHELGGSAFGDPLIVDGKVYVGDERGDVSVFKLSKEKERLAICNVDDIVVAPPVFANGTLYIETVTKLFAIKQLP